MSEKTLKFGNIVVNKKEFHASKQAIALNSVKTGKILASYEFTVMTVLNILLVIYMMMMI